MRPCDREVANEDPRRATSYLTIFQCRSVFFFNVTIANSLLTRQQYISTESSLGLIRIRFSWRVIIKSHDGESQSISCAQDL
jgi:hypothetical protein